MFIQQNIAPKNSEYPIDPDPTEGVTLTKNGDKAAFNDIVNKYQQPVYNFCYQMLQNRNEAEDAAQEVRSLLDTPPLDYRPAIILKYWYRLS